MSKRGNGEGNVRQRSDGTWEIRYIAGYKSDGKPDRKSVYGKTRREVTEKYTKIKHEIASGIYIEPTKMTFGDWLDTWMENYKKNSIRPTTYNNYEQHIRVHIKPCIGHLLLKDLRGDHLQSFYTERFRSGRQDYVKNKSCNSRKNNKKLEEDACKKELSLSSATIGKIHTIIHAALEQAVKNQLILRNVSEATILPKQSQKEINVMSLEMQEAFINALQGERLKPAFLVSLGTGLRMGELLALKWSNVDLKEGQIKVKGSLARVRYPERDKNKSELLIQEPKTASSKRVVPLPPSLTAILKAHRVQQLDERRKAFGAYRNNDLVFCTELGDYIEPRNFMRTFHRLCLKANIPRLNVHSMRHTFCTRMLEAGESPKVLQELVGHRNISQTLNTYTHVLEETKKKAMDKIDFLFQSKG